MKFRFCGDLDAPDWILAEVSVLSRMSSIRMKLIVRLILKKLLGQGLDYQKLNKLTTAPRLNFTPGDVKAMVAALTFVLRNAAKYDVPPEDLDQELQQLGLPRDICSAICKGFTANKEQLREHFRRTVLSLPQLAEADWRVDFMLGSSLLKTVAEPSVSLRLQIQDVDPEATEEDGGGVVAGVRQPLRELQFEVSADKFRALHGELQEARRLMKLLEQRE